MTIGSLFSGIGGLELGLEWAGLGPVKWQVEIDEKCRNCLATHWPDAKRFADVREVGAAELEPVDLICGGFPCQDISSAGKRAGLSGARSGLWFEFSRIVAELRPAWVVVENVTSGAVKWVDQVRVALERLGYASLPVPLAASDLGAWHRRERVFIVAHSDTTLGSSNGHNKTSDFDRHELRQQFRGGARTIWKKKRVAENTSMRTADVNDKRKLQSSGSECEQRRWSCDGNQWSAEPDVARMVHGLPGRVDRERALGNSVVPQCAEVIGHIVRILEES